ncbi:MAG: reverse transcriptase family protein [Pirellulaceae bacterium]
MTGISHPRNRQDVAQLVGVPLNIVNYLTYGILPRNQYDYFEIPKRSGGTRTVEAPTLPLKRMQRKLAAYIESVYSPTVYVHGYVAGRSIETNAQVHCGQRWLLSIDLSNFFPAINFGRVRGMLMSRPFNIPASPASLMAAILTVEGHLPHGSPASPVISNFICSSLDRRLSALAHDHRLRYSRYADDITFSTMSRSFPAALARRDAKTGETILGDRLVSLVTDSGFNINETKVRLTPRTQRLMVTGLVVNNKVNIPRQYVRETRALLHIWRRHGEKELAKKLTNSTHVPEFRRPLPIRLIMRGRVQYIGHIMGWDSSTYRSLSAELQLGDPAFRPRATSRSEGLALLPVRVFCEGATDYMHIRSFLSAFPDVASALGIELHLQESVAAGDSELVKKIEHAVHLVPSSPSIFVFDSDNPDIIRKYSQDDGGAVIWGRHIASLTLPRPPWVRQEDPWCIEMLYDKETLLSEIDGRRVYLRHEFDAEGWHLSDSSKYADGLRRTSSLVVERVTQRGTPNIALSKMAFAKAVQQRIGPFENLSFSAFVPLVEAIAVAARRSLIPAEQDPSEA